jgi:hypothetical protein
MISSLREVPHYKIARISRAKRSAGSHHHASAIPTPVDKSPAGVFGDMSDLGLEAE